MSEEKIDEIHPALQRQLTAMRRSRDFLAGADALRAHDMAGAIGSSTATVIDVRDRKLFGNGRAGGGYWGNPLTAYLPRLSEQQSFNDYCVYVMGAMYPNLLESTRKDFRGLIFSRAPVLDIPGTIDDMREDCDMRGTPIEEALEKVIDELYAVSRFGWWVDMPGVPEGTNRTNADKAGYRPYIVPFASEQIINWDFDHVGSRITLTRVVLKEEDDENEILELLLLPADDGATYIYTVRRWVKAKPGAVGKIIGKVIGAAAEGQWVQDGEDEIPLMGGAPIQEIPFYFFSPFGGEACPGRPMLDDLVMVAWSLYQSSALLEHSRFTCGLATALALGFPDDAVFDLGGLNVIKNSDPTANFLWAERKGEDCLPLERAVDQKKQLLIQMGAKALEEAKKAAESADALRIRSSGDTATCADIAQAVGRIASQALAFCARWRGLADPTVEIKLTTDYANNVADAAEITALDKSVTAGNLPRADYLRRLRKTGVIDADRTDEQLAADLESEAASRAEKQGSLFAQAAAARLAEAKAGGAASQVNDPANAGA